MKIMKFPITVESNYGVIFGDDVRYILEIIPELESSFTQRKSYDEYYFTDPANNIPLTLEQVVKLSDRNIVKFSGEEVTIRC
jgi:hypothetical protein